MEPTIALLTELFGFDAEDLRSTITGRKDSSYIRYKKQMTFEEKEKFETESKARNEAFTKNSEQKKILGVWFEDEYRRVYPNGSTACNVIGFAQKDGSAGSGGIEQYYNSSLVDVYKRQVWRSGIFGAIHFFYCTVRTDRAAVSYTHLDVYKRQVLGVRRRTCT